MRIGVGLPAAVPHAPPSTLPEWAAAAEDLGFSSVGVIDRLVLATMHKAWSAFSRAARYGLGWVAPSFGRSQLLDGIASARAAWADAARPDRPRIVVERYFCFGREARRRARSRRLEMACRDVARSPAPPLGGLTGRTPTDDTETK